MDNKPKGLAMVNKSDDFEHLGYDTSHPYVVVNSHEIRRGRVLISWASGDSIRSYENKHQMINASPDFSPRSSILTVREVEYEDEVFIDRDFLKVFVTLIIDSNLSYERKAFAIYSFLAMDNEERRQCLIRLELM